ncbi:MAG: WD40 repeat domain-containing protein, partial [Planctomycetes bacterium]|nr:WD40 repeat domain-containing protein [Planctomycetota bacterium]
MLLGVAGLALLTPAPLAAQVLVATLKGHTTEEGVTSVAFSPDGKRIASGSGGRVGKTQKYWGEVKVWDVRTGQEVLTLQGHTGLVVSVAFSSDGKRIASGSRDRTVKVWDAQTGQETLTLKGHTREVTSVAFSADGKRIASGSGPPFSTQPGEVKVWDAQTGQQTLSLKGHTGFVLSVAFSADGKRIVSG